MIKITSGQMILFAVDSIHKISFLDTNAAGMWIPMFHTVLNIVAAMIYLPLSGFFVKLAECTMPYNAKEKQEQENILTMLEPVLLMNPPIAVSQVNKALLKLAGTVFEACDMLADSSKHNKEGREEIIDSCDMVAHNLKPFQKQDMPENPEEEKKREKRREHIANLFGDKYIDLLNEVSN